MNYLDSIICLRSIYSLLSYYSIIILSTGHFRYEKPPAKSNAQAYIFNELFFHPQNRNVIADSSKIDTCLVDRLL